MSTAISIKNNWDLVFKNYDMPNYRMIRRLADLDAVQDGEFVIITLNQLTKYRKQIKRHIKMRNQNVCLVFDESDEMTMVVENNHGKLYHLLPRRHSMT